MRYLVTGGAGFVGSHAVLGLLDAGHEVEIVDNFSTGHRKAVPPGVRVHEIDLMDARAIDDVVSGQRFDAVLHFAAISLVGESMADPLRYFEQNYISSLNLVRALVNHNVRKLIFSSTAALFGGPERDGPIPDDALVAPGSPYGESKYLIERVLHWADRIHGLRSACLRYFNAAGADLSGRAGEDHRPETHLVPIAIDAALGRREQLSVFGTDYPTRDGSCIRDYLHVGDLSTAYQYALASIEHRSVVYNIGSGQGFSNIEVIRAVERVSGRKLPWEAAPRRGGDPAMLVADSTRFRQDTGWSPRLSSLESIVETAFRWRENNPQGFGS